MHRPGVSRALIQERKIVPEVEGSESRKRPSRSRRRPSRRRSGAGTQESAAAAPGARKAAAVAPEGKAAAVAPEAKSARPAGRRRRPSGGRTRAKARPAEGAPKAAAAPPAEAAPEEEARARPVRRRRGARRTRVERPAARAAHPRTMLVTVGKDRVQIAILEKRELIEHYVAHAHDPSIVGNVYLGKVHKVLPGMEAAFLDIGQDRNAVLYVGELGFDEEVEGERPRIETVLRSGQAVLAQVTKDPMRAKGARLTTEVSIPGRYVVLVPEANFIGISRRLPDDERKRLRDVAARIQPPGFGVIVRTAAEDAGEDELDRDVSQLVGIWYEVQQSARKAKPPKLVHSEPELVIRVVRDLFTRDVERVIVDDPDVFEKLRTYISEVTPDLAERVERHDGRLPLFEQYHVVEQIRKAVDRKVWLPSGGHIVIDRTEAMTVIDVNTGRYVGKSTLEETVLRTNLEAAEQVAKQLRLLDIGGIIVVDFIDMIEERNREEVVRVFKAALAKDKTRTQVYGISELGLLQMTRKKVSEGLVEAFSSLCQECEGRGIVLTDLD